MTCRKLVALVLGVAIVTPALAQRSHAVRGYTRKNGTYVAPHRATNQNATKLDNWTTRGNVNPYTGGTGTKDPFASAISDTRPSAARGSYR